MHQLCIVLSSSYPSHLPRFFNEEIQQDLALIKTTLYEHDIVEIILPFTSKKLSQIHILQKTLNLLDISSETHCHIVLNTHGCPGRSDLKHDCIIYLLNFLSQMQATITQISALQCEGMKAASSTTYARLNHRVSLADMPTKAYKKTADLVTLQKKLNALTLDREQNFTIRGFEHAYEPLKDSREVQDLLQGRIGIALDVSIPAKTYDFEQIMIKLPAIQNSHTLSKKAYQELSDYFGKLIHHIKQKLFVALHCHHDLATSAIELQPLLNELCIQGKMAESDFYRINFNEKEAIYRNWLRKYKLNSPERIAVFFQFALQSIAKQTNSSIKPAI